MKLSLVFIVTMFLTPLVAQEEQEEERLFKVSLFGGAALPQGDFKSTNGNKSGFARTGFCVTGQGAKRISPNAYWATSVAVAFNGLDDAAMQNQLSGITVETGSYTTTWALTGIQFSAPTSEHASVYGIGQIGVLFSSFPDITLTYAGTSITQTTKLATAFCFGIGGGVELGKMNIGFRYYSSEPEYEQTASYQGVTASAKVTMPASLLVLMLGVNF